MKLNLNYVSKAFVMAMTAVTLSLPFASSSEAASNKYDNHNDKRPAYEQQQISKSGQQSKTKVEQRQQPKVEQKQQPKVEQKHYSRVEHREPEYRHDRPVHKKNDVFFFKGEVPKNHRVCRDYGHRHMPKHFHCSKSYHKHKTAYRG